MELYFPDTPNLDPKIEVLTVPWDATTSYLRGTSKGPDSILEASRQLDFFHSKIQSPETLGFFWHDPNETIQSWNKKARDLVDTLRNSDSSDENWLNEVNSYSAQCTDWVYQNSLKILNKNKILAILGGDHSSPLGGFLAAKEYFKSFSILHIDAHMDLRNSYEGFHESHASIMRNAVVKLDHSLESLTSVSVRDYCEEEVHFVEENKKIKIFSDSHLNQRLLCGETWLKCVQDILASIKSSNVWISFDIDGLDPSLCPHTGTPVPGGLSWHQALFLIESLARSEKKIIGFDLCEVAPSEIETPYEWDANIGMRLFYQLGIWTGLNQGFLKPKTS